MADIAVIADRITTSAFRAVGFTPRECDDASQATAALDELAANPDIAVVLVADFLVSGMADALARYRYRPQPSIVIIPSARGNLGIGNTELRDTVRRAVGADILAEKKE